MTELPIIMSGAMVRAILSGTKTQTRRVVMPQPPTNAGDGYRRNRVHCNLADDEEDILYAYVENGQWSVRCPYGAPGDRLWVRETFACVDGKNWYRADPGVEDCIARSLIGWPGWRPAIHMPRKACRLVLEVTGVRVERLQDISGADASAEGIDTVRPVDGEPFVFRDYGSRASSDPCEWFSSPIDSYRSLWDSLNGKRGYGWATNPWVWVVEFRRADARESARPALNPASSSG